MSSTTTLWYSTTTTTTACPCHELWDSREKTHSTDGWTGIRLFACEGGTGMVSPEDCCPVDLYDTFPGGPATLLARKIHWKRASGGADHTKDVVMTTVDYSTEKNSSLTVQEYDITVDWEYQVVDKANQVIPGEEGVEVATPMQVYKCIQHLAAFPTAAVFAITGRVNDVIWGGWAARTWLFMGAQGRRSGLGSWETTYVFVYNPNTWNYLPRNWSAGGTETRRVYYDGDFTTLPGVVTP